MFTWGRGDYGQLGRQASTSRNPEQQSAGPSAESGNQEAVVPAEVQVLHGATQVRLISVIHLQTEQPYDKCFYM